MLSAHFEYLRNPLALTFVWVTRLSSRSSAAASALPALLLTKLLAWRMADVVHLIR